MGETDTTRHEARRWEEAVGESLNAGQRCTSLGDLSISLVIIPVECDEWNLPARMSACAMFSNDSRYEHMHSLHSKEGLEVKHSELMTVVLEQLLACSSRSSVQQEYGESRSVVLASG